MRVPVESNERTEGLQEEIVSLAEDIIDINDQLDEMTEIENWIIDNCISLCDIVKHTNDNMDELCEWMHIINNKLENHMEDFDDKVAVSKIIIALFVIFFVVWNSILTYYIVNGI